MSCGCGMKFFGGAKRKTRRSVRKGKKSKRGTRRVRKH